MQTITTSGLEIVLADDQVAEHQCWSTAVNPGLWSGVMMRGKVMCAAEGLGETLTTPASLVTFHTTRPIEFRHRSLNTGTLSAVFVRIGEDALIDLLGEEGAATLGPARTLAEALRPGVNPAPRALALQMLACPENGASRRLYLAAKALEFLAAVVDSRAVQGDRAGCAPCHLAPRDIGRVLEARDIILSDLGTTPSVPELARQVGLNARKLTRGFDALFGASVYAFIKTARLERAKSLIESGAMTVSEAAYATGYHPGHLSTEFRRRFGVAPSQMRRTTRWCGFLPDGAGPPTV
ncbi:helix-turn-helix domain-containing protein [Roseospirillum parvum]|uniref:AraC family transcriptional regulator, transcriptional activator of the genes for pyochelin and ferripyochelin receptors n=1 Tax=Roseospirillum parvum TaxID=83401 RepID=A0A1G8C629_9PROT|nr:AraC family transcriptional regulator [Roseospirillum parvum]SDH40824.1 AraC family transcriptional regulator, transcriptional activator of the genes for pyochelin and ferripyochelin receptors [Roseospirillum parvum]